MDRRTALWRAACATLGCGWALGACSRLDRNAGPRPSLQNQPAHATPADDSADGQLIERLGRLDKRVYSEEGIPMLLGLADLGNPAATRPATSPENARLAAALRRDAAAFIRARPEAGANDVARLVELLAADDFAAGGVLKTGRANRAGRTAAARDAVAVDTRADAGAGSAFRKQAAAVGDMLAGQPLIRTINFHNTTRARAAEYARQLEHLSRHFSPVTEQDLDAYLRTGRWSKPKPGLIVALYEGYRNHYDIYAPLLERHGFIGWFFVITGFVKAPPSEQAAFARQHDITLVKNEYADGRHALSWTELRELNKRHVIASHARSHTALASLDAAALASEVRGSQDDFERNLGHPVRTFVSYSGPAHGEHPAVDRVVADAGYRFVVSNFQIQRLPP